MPHPRGKQELPVSLSHNIFSKSINILSEEQKFFVCGIIHPNPGKCLPVLYDGYLMIKDAEWAARELSIIHSVFHNTRSVSSKENPMTHPQNWIKAKFHQSHKNRPAVIGSYKSIRMAHRRPHSKVPFLVQ